LRDKGSSQGWSRVADSDRAQEIANHGCLVIASFANANPHKPGHIAVVRPSDISKQEITAHGPMITQAGMTNYNETTLETGFAHHKPAFQDHEILFFAHTTEFCHQIK
jgi:hypothetical protein